MNPLARIREGVRYADLHHLDRPGAIAAYVIATQDGLLLVDPGPAACLDTLGEALRADGASFRDVRHVLLTHIHLDHAGAVGTLVRAHPRIRVHVHARGAPHLADPTRLLASARRIYGDAMGRMWGDLLPVPTDRLAVLEGGDRLVVGERRYAVAYTPGHAVHHACFLDEHEGLAFVGDLAGEASQHGTPAVPAAPPPDVDLASWRASLDLVSAWRPEELLLTHFGPVVRPIAHMDEMWERLLQWSERVRESLSTAGDDDLRADRFADEERAHLCEGLPAEQAQHVDSASIRSSWFGLARYWRTQVAEVRAARPDA